MIDFSTYLFHPHALHMLMKEPKEKEAREAGEMAETTKAYLCQIFTECMRGRKKDISNKYIEKGLAAEETGITLYSRYRNEFFVKNKETLRNEWLEGTPDIRTVEILPWDNQSKQYERRQTFDVKCSWDVFTHDRKLAGYKPSDEYYWQGQGYMWLDDAERHTVAHCLVDTPEFLIEKEIRKLKYEVPDEYMMEAENELRRLMTYSDIPLRERVIEFTFTHDQVAIYRIKSQVEKARLYLQVLQQKSKL